MPTKKLREIGFNSTLVQLKEGFKTYNTKDGIMFQFYLSSIKRGVRLCLPIDFHAFQFYLSSIKRR